MAAATLMPTPALALVARSGKTCLVRSVERTGESEQRRVHNTTMNSSISNKA